MKFPKHECSLSLVHNEHNMYYQTVKEAIDDDNHGYEDWISEEQKQKAIDSNECWYIQVYPYSPNQFYTYAAADLDKLMEFIINEEAVHKA